MSNNKWSDKENGVLLDKGANTSNTKLSAILKRSPSAICHQLLRLKIKKTKTDRQWTFNDDEYLMSKYCKMSYRSIAGHLGRSEHAIRNRLKILGARRKTMFSSWTAEEDRLLTELYNHGKSIDEMCGILGRSACSIRLRANKKLNAFRQNRYLKIDLPNDNFYYNLKRILTARTAGSKCCICGYSKYIDLHHIDANHKNHHKANIASLCPNCHREVQGGEHVDKNLYCEWWRIYPDGRLSKSESNKELVNAQRQSKNLTIKADNGNI